MIRKYLISIGTAVFITLLSISIVPSFDFANVCAQTKWGGCAEAYATCPTGKIQSHCSQATDFNITVNGTGIAIGQTFAVYIYPADGTYTCPDVTCLERRVSGYTFTWPGGTSWSETFNQIGCSSGACPNAYKINVYMTGAELSGSCTVNPAGAIYDVTIANGLSIDKTFTFTCIPVSTATPTSAPTATSVPPTATTTPGSPTATTAPPTATTVPGGPTSPPASTPTTPPGVPTATRAPSATPKAPTPTATVPACGSTCSSKPDCDGSKDGCVECLPDATGKKVCSKPPACGTPCASKATCDGAKDGCNECIPDSTGKKVCAPTPFTEEMCKCDGLKFGSILFGKPLAVTAFGKVSGDDVKYAKIPSFTFKFFESEGGTSVKEITSKTTKVPTTIISTSPTLVRYQADWVLKLDADLDIDKTYRIQAKPECSKKISLYQSPTTSQPKNVVLAAEDKKLTLWDRIVGFFAGVFGTRQSTQNIAGRTPTPTLTAEQLASLRIGTIKPATYVEELPDPESKQSCTFIRFKF